MIGDLRECMEMLASMDHDASYYFEVKLKGSEITRFNTQGVAFLEKGLQPWVRAMYHDIKYRGFLGGGFRVLRFLGRCLETQQDTVETMKVGHQLCIY